ncbi:MAG: bifunctional diaminohydroxyphosphoribosylaminopyrimidine deaminase/5-amino-6-(5-phosphoribosylamino)uracil reductase RibD [Thermodesulfobacteriota bacterium]
MMALALAEARKGEGRTSPNPMVGAVVARNDLVLAKGYHARAGGPHAEIVALSRAGVEARGATLYVTLEPCNHYGRTPPCTEAILGAGIKEVVIAQKDPNPQVIGRGAEYLSGRGLKVTLGVLEDKARALNEFWLKHVTTGRPYVILKSAVTLDGKLATRTRHSRWVTGEKARAFVHRLRDRVDAILVGRGTVEADDPALNTRRPGRRPVHNPIRIILDTHLSLPLSARVLDPAVGGPTIVACGPRPARAKVKALTRLGAQVWPLPRTRSGVSLTALLEKLGRAGVISLLIEGGAEVNEAAVLGEKIVDKLLFFYAPKLVGGREAPGLIGGRGAATMAEAVAVDILSLRRLGPDLLMEAVPRY